ncbi:MAG: phage tail tape measure protein [Phycisphaerales bacterium]
MSLLIGAISASLNLDTKGYTGGLLNAQAATNAFGQTFSSVLVNPLLGAVTILKQFGGAVFAASDRLLNMAESVGRVSQLTGVSVETIQTLRNVLGDMGLSAEGADAALTAFNRKLGDAKKDGGAAAANLAKLGIDLSNVGTGEAALRNIFDQLSKISDGGVRAAAAAEIFDRQFGAAMLSAVRGGSREIDALNANFVRLGRTLSGDAIKNMEELDAIMDRVKGTAQGVSNTLLLEFLRGVADGAGKGGAGIEALGNTIRRDLAEPARQAGEAVTTMVAAISDLGEGIKAVGELPVLKQILQLVTWNLTRASREIESVGTFLMSGSFSKANSDAARDAANRTGPGR